MVRKLFIYITMQCNLTCKHCNVSCTPRESKFLDIDRLEDILSKLGDRSFEEVNITGGEPFLHKGLPEIYKLLRKRFPRQLISISSNGTVNPLKSKLLLDENSSINISFDGFSKAHNLIRGDNAFERAERNLGFYRRISKTLNANVVVNNQNYLEVEELAQWLYEKHKFNEVRLLPLIYEGRANEYVEFLTGKVRNSETYGTACESYCDSCSLYGSLSIYPNLRAYRCNRDFNSGKEIELISSLEL